MCLRSNVILVHWTVTRGINCCAGTTAEIRNYWLIKLHYKHNPMQGYCVTPSCHFVRLPVMYIGWYCYNHHICHLNYIKSHKFGEWGQEQGWESDVAFYAHGLWCNGGLYMSP
jgi:hypothetical protein